MKRNILIISLSLFCALFASSQVHTNPSGNKFPIEKTQEINLEQLTSPWVSEVGFTYNMPVKAQINKEGVLFQPTGLILGVFKNGKCHGQSENGLSTGPGGIKYNNLTMGCNTASETGFTYKAYDPNTNTIYNITETLDFQSNVALGTLIAPIQLHISGISALKETKESFFNVFPNPVKSDFSINLGSEASNNSLIELYNVDGKLIHVIYKGETALNQVINARKGVNIPKGIYFIKVTVGSKVSVKKVIIN